MSALTPMKLRATYRAPDAGRYRAPGGAWDVPVLDDVMRQRPPGTGAVLVDGEHRFDGPQLESLVAGLAGGLRSMGVRRGDVVTWQMPNWWEALVLYRACWRCGAVAAPLHHQFGAAEVELHGGAARAHGGVLVPGTALGRAGGHHRRPYRGLSLRCVVGGEPLTSVRPRPRRHPQPSRHPSPNHPADLAVVIFTSGSTGRPKAVLHTHRGLAYKAQKMTAVHGLSGADAVLMPAPLAHISGLLNAVLVPGRGGHAHRADGSLGRRAGTASH